MQSLTGAVIVAAALLVLAGTPKVFRPASTVVALRAVGLTFVSRSHVRILAAVEVAVGVVALLVGGVVPALAVAALYAGFSGFLVLALRSSAVGVSCGCTGKSDTPPTYAHLALTAILAVLALGAALAGGGTGLTGAFDSEGLAEPLLLVAFSGVGTWLGWVVMNDLPDLALLRATATDH